MNEPPNDWENQPSYHGERDPQATRHASHFTKPGRPVPTAERPAPLSYSQERLWFLDKLSPGNCAYNLPFVYRLSGPLQVAVLEKCLSEIIRRHEVLRTIYPVFNGRASQIVMPHQDACVPVLQLQARSGEEMESEVQRLILIEIHRAFELGTDVRPRAVLLRRTADEHFLLFVFHHLCFDGWSMSLFAEELSCLYESFSRGRTSPLPDLPIQYSDFTIWQRAQMADSNDQLSYWIQQLEGARNTLDLQLDRPRPPIQTYRGARQPLRWTDTLSANLRFVCRQENVTMYMLLLATYSVLLHRYTQQDDLLIGSPIAGRTCAEAELLIGCFVNTLVLRARFSPGVTFTTLLRQLRQTTLDAYAHQHIPFERLVEALRPERDLSRNALFQAMFAFQNTPVPDLHLEGVIATPVLVETRTSKFDLTLEVQSSASPMYGWFEYNTNLFGSDFMRRMAAHFITILEEIIRQPQARIGSLPLMDQVERRQILVEWNDTQKDFGKYQSVPDSIEEQAASIPDATAVQYGIEMLTYCELNRRANQLAHFLRSLGVGVDTPVGVCMERSLAMVVALLGILKSGGAYVPLDPEYPKERLDFMIADTRLRVVLIQTHLVERFSGDSVQLVNVDGGWNIVAGFSETDPKRMDAPESLAYIIYTSGSTGRPKGVASTHLGLCNRLRWMQDVFGLTRTDVVLQKTTFSFDVSVWEFFWPLSTGARLALARPQGHKDSEYLAETILQHHITTVHFVPSMLRVFLEQRTAVNELPCLKRVICSGETLPPEVASRFFSMMGASLHNLYGPTEASIDVTSWTCTPAADSRDVPIGFPIANIRIHILDENMEPAPPGVKGQLHISGVGLARGYLYRPDLTAQFFVPDPVGSEPGARLYKTGDLAYYRENGAIAFLGRMDDQVKIRGFRVELGEIEAALGQHPSIAERAVVLREDAAGSRALVAYVALKPDHKSTVSDLRAFLSERLPDYMLPATFVFLKSLPLTTSGKIDRRTLPTPSHTRPDLEESFVAPETPEEIGLANVWKTVLGIDRIGTRDSFFDLGGDSIRIIQVISAAREMGFDFTVQQFFQAPTIYELINTAPKIARGVEHTVKLAPFSLLSAEERSKIPDDVEDAYPMSMLQQGMVFHSEHSPESHYYQVVISYHIQSRLDAEAFCTATEQVIQRHPMLRTSYDLTGVHRPLQLVHRQAKAQVEVFDLMQLAPSEQERAIDAWFEAEMKRPFDWAVPPLFRVALHSRGEEAFQFGMSFHDSILDGWSAASLTAEIFHRYRDLSRGGNMQIALPPTVGFGDFVALELKTLASEESQCFWQDRLRDYEYERLPRWPFVLPVGHIAHNRDCAVPIPVSICEGLKSLARSSGVPLKSALLAAHMRVLSLIGGRSDVVTGLVCNGRLEVADGDKVIGDHLNTLPFRINLTGGTWKELLQETYRAEEALQPFRRYPSAQLQKDCGGQPLFEVAFNYTHFHVYEGFDFTPDFRFLSGKATDPFHYPLAVNFRMDKWHIQGPARHITIDDSYWRNEPDSELLIILDFNDGELSEDQVRAIGGYYYETLKAMAMAPEASYSTQCLLSEKEKHRVLREWNPADTCSAEALCVHTAFEVQVRKTPDSVAVVCGDRALTFSELNSRANQLARHLLDLCVGKEELVGVCMEPSLEMIVSLLGILKAGGAYLPMDPEYPRERLSFMLADTQVRVLLAKADSLSLLPHFDGHVVNIDDDWHSIALKNERDLGAPSNGDQLCYVIYTSGSTGQPKGVCIPHCNLLSLLAATQHQMDFNRADVWTLFHSFSFDFSVWEMWGPLLSGGKLIVTPRSLVRSPDEFYPWLREQQVTVLNQTPSAFYQLLSVERQAEKPVQNSALRLVIFGGEALSVERLEPWFRQHGDQMPQLINMYGITETTIHASYWPISSTQPRTPLGSRIGRALSHLQLFVLDREMRPLPIGVPGELYVGGRALARGYLGQAILTAERFVPDGHGFCSGGRLYRSGDRARWLPDGALEYLGRLDRQVKVRGFRIEPREIESALKRHVGVRDAVVMAREDAPDEKRLAAYIVPNANERPTVSDLRTFLKERIPDYMLPAAFVFLDLLPLTVHGKIDYRVLPAPDASRPDLAESYAGPRNPVEESLVAIWQTVLGLERIGIHDDFFELGGDSILSLQIVHRARQARLRITPKQIFEYPTIANLAVYACADKGLQADQGPVVGTAPLLPIQHWFFERPPREWNASFFLEARLAKDSDEFALDASALEQALHLLLIHHDALRLRFRFEHDAWMQWIAGPEETIVLRRADLSSLASVEQESKVRQIVHDMQNALDISTGPLLQAALLDYGPNQPSRIVLVVHHLAIDGVSWRILAEDLGMLYGQLRLGGSVTLPPKGPSFKFWAEQVYKHAQSDEVISELTYWTSRVPKDRPLMPLDCPCADHVKGTTRSLTVELTAEETRALLQDVASGYAVQINDTLLCALVRAFDEWTHERSLLVDVHAHGREELFEDVDVSRTVGWFTTIFPVFLDIKCADDLRGALGTVRQQLREIPRRGFGYGLLRYLNADPQVRAALRALPEAQVSFNYLGQFKDEPSSNARFRLSANPMGPTDRADAQGRYSIEVYALVSGGQLHVTWLFSDEVVKPASIDMLANAYLRTLRELIVGLKRVKAESQAVAGFPLAELDENELRALSKALNDE